MRPVKESRACKSNKRRSKLQISLRFSLLSDSTSVVYPVNEAYAHRKGKRIDVNTTITGTLSSSLSLFYLSLSHYFFLFFFSSFLSISIFFSLCYSHVIRSHDRDHSGWKYICIDRYVFSLLHFSLSRRSQKRHDGEADKNGAEREVGGVVCALAKPGKNGQHKTVNVM